MAKIGDKIKQLRLEKGIRQDDLAASAGITKSSISNYERNQRSPQYSVLIKIAGALGVPVAELLVDTTEENENKGKTREDQTDSRRLRRVPKLMEAFEKLSNEAQKIAIERIEELTLIPKYKVPLQESLQRHINNKYLIALDIPKGGREEEIRTENCEGFTMTHIILKRKTGKEVYNLNFYYYQSESPADTSMIEQLIADYKGSWIDGPVNMIVLDNKDDYNLFYGCNDNQRVKFDNSYSGGPEPPEIPIFLVDKETGLITDSDDYGFFGTE